MNLSASNFNEQVGISLIDIQKDLLGAFQEDLVSLVLFGSAAESKLRASSDVNLLVVLKKFEKEKIDCLREMLRTQKAKINLNTMFLLESELTPAANAFAVKFQDILSRHKILYGENITEKILIERSAVIQRLKQVLMNMKLRLREHYALQSLREEQLWALIADTAGPLRAAAAQILFLRDKMNFEPKIALQKLAGEFEKGALYLPKTLEQVSACREGRGLPKGDAPTCVFHLISLIDKISYTVEELSKK